jgi:hypothetical protein
MPWPPSLHLKGLQPLLLRLLLEELSMDDFKLPGESNLKFVIRTSGYQVGTVFKGHTPGREYRVLELQNAKNGVYGLLEMTDEVRRHTSTIAMVIQIKTTGKYIDCKKLSELDGPNLAEMPEKMLRKLSELDAFYFSPDEIRRSTEWRAKCRKTIANRAALVPGAKFATANALAFGDAGSCSEFEVVDLKARTFRAHPGQPNTFLARFTPGLLDRIEFTVHP